MSLGLRTILVSIILSVLFALPAAADQNEDALAAYSRGDYATALRLMQPLANEGNARAQDKLGLMYYNGYGVQKDYAEAARWLRKAADQGIATSQNVLGIMYANGRGVPEDVVRAYVWFSLAAIYDDEDGEKNRNLIAQSMSEAQLREAANIALD